MYRSRSSLLSQHFVEALSNNTGYPFAKLVGKKIWRVYDTLNCQVATHYPARTHTDTHSR